MLGPGNEEAAKEALAAWPGGLQVGGGITDQNAKEWIDHGAEKVNYFQRQQMIIMPNVFSANPW